MTETYIISDVTAIIRAVTAGEFGPNDRTELGNLHRKVERNGCRPEVRAALTELISSVQRLGEKYYPEV